MAYAKGTVDTILFSVHHLCPCGNEHWNLPRIATGRDRSLDDDGYVAQIVYHLLRCPKCGSLQLKEFRECRDAPYNSQAEILGWDVRVLYQSPFVNDTGQDSSIPKPIRDVLSQAVAVASVSSRASVILCRATLEEICREFKVTDKGTLHDKISRLVKDHNLHNDLEEVLRGIKDFGNLGAHDAETAFTKLVTRKEVDVLIGLVKYVLQRLYVDQARNKQAAIDLQSLKAIISSQSLDDSQSTNS